MSQKPGSPIGEGEKWTVTRHGVELSIHPLEGKIAGCWELGAFYEEKLLQYWLRIQEEGLLPRGTSAIDAGAHIGNHTLWLAGVMQMDVFAWESDEASYAQLRANVRLNADRCGVVVASPVHLTDKGGEHPIDAFELERISLIKIDCDFHELEVLDGARDTIARCQPVVFIEQMEKIDPIAEILGPLNYRHHNTHNRRKGVHPVLEWRPRSSR